MKLSTQATKHEVMKCENCNREAEMFWEDAAMKNGFSETFYTAPDNRFVCLKCFQRLTGILPKTLHQLNQERKDENG